jgi:Tol biopolymer transport system component
VTLALGVLFASGCDYIARVSVDRAGGDANGESTLPSISGDGRYVAFTSGASDLVASDGNGLIDVFVRDLQAGTTTRVSVDTAGGDPDDQSDSASISANGRYVAFTSGASDLVAGDSNGLRDVFVRDLQTGTTTRASLDSTGGNANAVSNVSFARAISGDGRYVAFQSLASDLVPGDSNGTFDICVRDMLTSTTTRASVDTTGGNSNGASHDPSISTDGRHVAFVSSATDLVSGDGNALGDVFVRNLNTGTTTRASVDTGGGDPNQSGSASGSTSLSADGRYVAFDSTASDLVPGDDGSRTDIFRRDLLTATTVRVNPDVAGGNADQESFRASMSDDGRYVTYDSFATDLVTPSSPFGAANVYVRDLQAGTTKMASVDFLDRRRGTGSQLASMSADGRYVAFASMSARLVAGDGNGFRDVFVKGVVTPIIDTVTPNTVARGTSATLSVVGRGFFPGVKIYGPEGVTVTSVALVSQTQLEVSVSVAADAPTGAKNLAVQTSGGPGNRATSLTVCGSCLSIT